MNIWTEKLCVAFCTPKVTWAPLFIINMVPSTQNERKEMRQLLQLKVIVQLIIVTEKKKTSNDKFDSIMKNLLSLFELQPQFDPYLHYWVCY